MRLIDADVYEHKLMFDTEGKFVDIDDDDMQEIVYELRDMPTIDAIPVQFILEQMTEAVYKNEMTGDEMQNICRIIIGKWRKQNADK